VCPGRHKAGAALAIGEERGSQFADGLHVEFAESAAACVGNVTCVRIDVLDFSVPETPELEETLLMPDDVLTPGGILWVVRARQVQIAEGPKVFLTVLAVAHARAR